MAISALAITAGCATEEPDPAASSDESEIVTPLPEDIAIQVPGSNSCVDVANYSMSNGGPIHQWSCHYDANQLWRFTAVGAEGEAVYVITSRLSGLALDVTAVSTASGAPIQQWGYGGGNNQKFRVIDLGNGKFQLRAVHSGMCMSVTNTGTDADRDLGVLFRQYPCAVSDWHQQFAFKRRGTLQQKALVVLLQNGGYTGGLPFNPGFDIATGLRFQCDSHVVDLGLGASIGDAIRAIGLPTFDRCLSPANWSVTTLTRHYTAAELVRDMTNFVAESIGIATVYGSGAADRYSKIVILQDNDLRASKVRAQLQALASSYLIDVHVLAHGNSTSFGLNGEMNDADLRGLRTIAGLSLRSVFQQNCNGSGLNSAWLYAGAQVVTGTAGINSMPVAYGPFIRRWVAGETFFDAVQQSYNDVAPMHQAAYRFIDIYDEGASQPRNPAEYSLTGGLSPDDELNGSIQIVQGNGALVL
ncbi:MAG TPA: RICIN domain-containing protein [Kofleriaceae bacterium]|nr:RICIN domain-containing protein [Kofleriaceae bacterium]